MPVVNGLLEHAREKISTRRELRNKCREEYHPAESLVEDNGILKLGSMSDSAQPARLQDCSQAGTRACASRPSEEVTFEATITNSNPYGHAIETTTDGKLLHGMLFCCTSGFVQDKYDYPNKRMATDGGHARQNVYQPFMNTNIAVAGGSGRMPEDGQTTACWSNLQESLDQRMALRRESSDAQVRLRKQRNRVQELEMAREFITRT